MLSNLEVLIVLEVVYSPMKKEEISHEILNMSRINKNRLFHDDNDKPAYTKKASRKVIFKKIKSELI